MQKSDSTVPNYTGGQNKRRRVKKRFQSNIQRKQVPLTFTKMDSLITSNVSNSPMQMKKLKFVNLNGKSKEIIDDGSDFENES